MKTMKQIRKNSALIDMNADSSLLQKVRPEFALVERGQIYSLLATDVEYVREKAAPGEAWEHAMMMAMMPREHAPRYEDMCRCKDFFWERNEVVYQVFPRKADYVNLYEFLHLWRPNFMSARREQEIRELVKEAHEKAVRLREEQKENKKKLRGARTRPESAGEAGTAQRVRLRGAVVPFELNGTRAVAVFKHGRLFPVWSEVCEVKQEYFGEDAAAVQYHVSPEYDLWQQCVILFEPGETPLPPKELV